LELPALLVLVKQTRYDSMREEVEVEDAFPDLVIISLPV